MKQRILTGFILSLAILGILFFTSEFFFTGFSAFIVIIAAWEWSALCSLHKFKSRALYTFIIFLILCLSVLIPNYWLMWSATIWWLIAFAMVFLFLFGYTVYNKYILAIIGIFVLVPCWSGLNILRYSPNGAWMILFFMLIIAALDAGAYFMGTWVGKTKLASKISPKKTVEGLLSGIVLAFLIAYLFLSIVPLPASLSWLEVMGLVMVLAVFAVLGDLFESMVKRIANVKDSGKILPGHGGILDRIDSYTAAIPPFVLLLIFIGYLY